MPFLLSWANPAMDHDALARFFSLLASLPVTSSEPAALGIVDDAVGATPLGVTCYSSRALGIGDVALHWSSKCARGLYAFELIPVDHQQREQVASLVRPAARLLAGQECSSLRIAAFTRPGSLGVDVVVEIPPTAPKGATFEVTLSAPTIFSPAPSFTVRILGSVSAPLRLEPIELTSLAPGGVRPCTPAIAPGGTVFVPTSGSTRANVSMAGILVLAADGSRLAHVKAADVGLGHPSSAAVCELEDSGDGESPGGGLVLLLADKAARLCRIVCHSLLATSETDDSVALGPARWATEKGSLESCYGIAVLPREGVCFATSYVNDSLVVHRLSDGARVASLTMRDPNFIAADPDSSTVFVGDFYGVHSGRWVGGAGGGWARRTHVGPVSTTVLDSPLTLIDSPGIDVGLGRSRPMAYMPPCTRNARHIPAYLVIGTMGTPILYILALPSLRLVLKHHLHDAVAGRPTLVRGLAGDPLGGALLVWDESIPEQGLILTLPWPLADMCSQT